ncbi:cytochrome c [Verrucomicrobiales bacterium BCK34]|nr:cytochrome c [Verrucomicrobiales bacterium BCK34]
MKRALIFTLTAALSPVLAEEVNYSRDIAPVVQANCAGCHREGGGAPFNLTDYESTKRKARTIQRVVEKRYMPPWHATNGDIPLVDDRRLTDAQIELFKKWVEAGRPEGDPADLPAPREYPDGWKLGEPDLVLKMADVYELPADGPDIYRSFVIPTGLKKDKYLKAIEFRPSTPSVVHHSLFSVDTKGRARKADLEDPEPGFAEMPIGEGSGRSIGGWVPGASPRPLPDGLAHHIPAGSDIVLQSHFHLTGKPEKEQSEIALYFDSKPPERHFTTIQLPPAFGAFSGIDLAPGESETVVTDSFELPVAVRAFGAHPHSHYRGKSLSMTAHLPDGSSIALLDIPDWDMNWQEEYRFTEEVALPAGTRLEAKIVWDNSAGSSDNPVVPPVRVRWGLESYDEMGSIDLFVIPEGNRNQSTIALKQLNNAKRDHLVWKAGSHVVGPDKLTVFGKLRNDAIARFDANNDGILGQDERARAKQSLEAVLP